MNNCNVESVLCVSLLTWRNCGKVSESSFCCLPLVLTNILTSTECRSTNNCGARQRPEFQNSYTLRHQPKYTVLHSVSCMQKCLFCLVAKFWYRRQVIFLPMFSHFPFISNYLFCNFPVSAQISFSLPCHISSYVELPINYFIDLTVLRYLTVLFLCIHLQLRLFSFRSFFSFSLPFSMPHYGRDMRRLTTVVLSEK